VIVLPQFFGLIVTAFLSVLQSTVIMGLNMATENMLFAKELFIWMK
jgi:hypothetical protein